MRDAPAAEKLDRDAIIGIECDLWLPATRPDVVREDNAGRLRTKLVLQGANIPFTDGAERQLAARGVLPREAALALATRRVRQAMEYRRFSIL